ncbi:AAA family ATPase [Sphingomonas glacialis]|uniref:Rad50/SbcC-type AAA domain-containing protein n=1 Tax=Sphingomonas glacialis TaxID=658225 RepID=A0A502FFC5_9SPHN|nr:AAA family ATPase [Sphingomonas glacialis]TPG48081.1 hypothetical protein EAH76_21965 [Sphingomonas glacialis]
MNNYLRQITLSDFRTFGTFKVDLVPAPGLTIVTGTNGLGKSSFFDAIEWCLTGAIRRFTPEIIKKTPESDYLTRDGAEADSHAVELLFQAGQQIVRGRGDVPDPAYVIEALRADSWKQPVASVSTYLALTHFLGQTAGRRFTALPGPEQWQALKSPSGVDRYEVLRNRLGGRATTAAFNKRVEEARQSVAIAEEQLARWDLSLDRLRRLEESAAGQGALSPEQVFFEVQALAERFSLVAATPVTMIGTDPTDGTRSVRAAFDEEARLVTLRLAVLEQPEIASIVTTLATEQARIADLRADADSFAARLSNVTGLVEEAFRKRHAAEAESRRAAAVVQPLKDRLAAVDASLEDLDRVVATKAVLATQQAEAEILAAVIEATKGRIRGWEDQTLELSQRRAARIDWDAQVSRLTNDLQAARELSGLEQAAIEADAAVALDVDNPDDVDAPSDEIRQRLVERVGIEQQKVDDGRLKSTALAAALSRIAAHLDEHSTECPVCASSFPPGALQVLANAAASGDDQNLRLAEASLAEARKALSDHERRVEAYASRVQRRATAFAKATLARRHLAEQISIIATRLSAEPEWDVARLATLALDRLNAFERTADPDLPALAELTDRQRAAAEDLATQRLELREATLRSEESLRQRDEMTARLSGIETRLSTRLPGFDPAGLAEHRLDLVTSIATASSAESEAAAAFARETEAHRLLADERVSLQGEIGRVEGEISGGEARRQSAVDRWRNVGLAGEPDSARLELELQRTRERRDTISEFISELDALAVAQARHSSQLEVARVRTELEAECRPLEVSIVDARSTYAVRIEAARTAEKHIIGAAAMAKRIAASLQSEASSYSSNVLAPLNELIHAFKDALAPGACGAVTFETKYRADRTDLSMKLVDGRAGEEFERRDVNPQLRLSEGQLAANALSILCSASTSYRWSNWRALLLDDPLQHNDVIHAAAFVDLVRNLAQIEQYQLFMSTHDLGEAEFVRRKMSAEGLPCTTINLHATSAAGVSFGVDRNRRAQEMLADPERMAG